MKLLISNVNMILIPPWAIVSRIEKTLGVECLPMPDWRENGLDPMIAGAIGAALFAKALYKKQHGKQTS